MTKHAELPRVDITSLEREEVTIMLRRQLPRSVRRFVLFYVRPWELHVWCAAKIYPYPMRYWDKPTVVIPTSEWSAPMLNKPRRFENTMVGWGTLDPELISMIVLQA